MRRRALRWAQHTSLLVSLVALGAAGWMLYERIRERSQAQANLAAGMRVGIVAGHSGFDSGAVCPDGLTEVEVNQDVAQRTAELLRRAGAEVDILLEYDPRLDGYRADAFVSIHADSCLKDLSGFKVARVAQSAVPEAEDRLVDCLWQYYAEATALAPHPNSITHDMREYHAFREIDPYTPGAIIEVGFMGGDRRLLTRRPDVAAKGVAQGILCFLTQSGPGDQ